MNLNLKSADYQLSADFSSSKKCKLAYVNVLKCLGKAKNALKISPPQYFCEDKREQRSFKAPVNTARIAVNA
jgi:hypothetical protein